MGVLKVFSVRILFASRPIACEMGVLKVFIVDLLHENQFAGRPIAYEMGVTIFNEPSITY